MRLSAFLFAALLALAGAAQAHHSIAGMYDSSRNTTLEDAHEDLKRRGITHVLYSPGLFKFAARMGRSDLPDISQSAAGAGPEYRPQLRNWATFEMYSSRFLEPVYSYHDYQVFRLK